MGIVDNCDTIEEARKLVRKLGIMIKSAKTDGGYYLNPAEGKRKDAVENNIKLRKALSKYRTASSENAIDVDAGDDDE